MGKRMALWMALAISGAAVAQGAGPIGFAAANALGRDGTIGGQGGDTVTVSDFAQLKLYGERKQPTVIRLAGIIKAPVLKLASDKTLEGAGKGAGFTGSILVHGGQNVIIRNLMLGNLKGGQPDAVQFQASHHIWLDHNDICDSPDGLVDMTHGVDYVTVSWNKLHYSDPSQPHRLAMLIGHEDANEAEDAGKFHVTIHGNWWAENIQERMPRVRYGKVHVFGNYYAAKGNHYCISSRIGATVLVENNFFLDVGIPFENLQTGQLLARGNVLENSGKPPVVTGIGFPPGYPYALDPGADVPDIVKAGAGPFNGKTVGINQVMGAGRQARAAPPAVWTDARGRLLIPHAGAGASVRLPIPSR